MKRKRHEEITEETLLPTWKISKQFTDIKESFITARTMVFFFYFDHDINFSLPPLFQRCWYRRPSCYYFPPGILILLKFLIFNSVSLNRAILFAEEIYGTTAFRRSFNSFANFSLCNVQRWVTVSPLRSNIIFGNRWYLTHVSPHKCCVNGTCLPINLPCYRLTLPPLHNYSSNVGRKRWNVVGFC